MTDNSKAPPQDKAESGHEAGQGQHESAAAAGADKGPQKPAEKAANKAAEKSTTSGTVKGRSGSSSRGKTAVFVEVLFNIVLLGGIGFIGFLVYEQDKAIDVLFEQQNAFNSQRSAANARIGQLQASLAEYDDAIRAVREENSRLVQVQGETLESLQSDIDRLQGELVSMRLRMIDSNPGTSQEWLLAEAASLLRLAQQHLVVARSVRTAQALYIAADEILKQVDDPAIFSVREILAGELASLRAVEEVNRQDIYLQLGAIAEQAATLQVTNDLEMQLAEGERLTLSPADQVDNPGWFSRMLASIRTTLDNYLVVRRRDVPVQPLMTPGQEAALMQIIQLQIEQARTALLREEQEIFTASLGRARDNIDRFLGGNSTAKSAVLNALDSLGQRRIVTEPPPLSRARNALEQILSVSPDAVSE